MAIEKTQELIPHYRDIDFFEGFYYFLKGEKARAKESFTTMQKYDHFHRKSNQFLLKISVEEKNEEEWAEQFKILNKILLKKSRLLDKKSAIYGEVELSDRLSGHVLQVEKTSRAYRLTYTLSFVKELLNRIHDLKHGEEAKRQQEKEKTYQFIVRQIYKNPFFRIDWKIKEIPSVQEREEVRRSIVQYISLVNTIERERLDNRPVKRMVSTA